MSRNSQRGYDQGRRGQGGQGGRGWTPAYSSGGYGAGSNAHNPYEVQMPRFLEAITDATHAEDQSIIVVDKRDDRRIVSPFQSWLVSEIMSNAASSINVMTERDQVMPPNSGFHVALFGNYTLDGIKVAIAISIESNTGNPCAGWDESTARANNRIDLKCSRTSVPGTWLTVSHISGPTLIRTITSVRENRARVEGPEQTEQFAQLAAIHEGWWSSSVAEDESQVGSLVIFAEDLDQGNFHLQSRSKLLERESEIVPSAALAEMQHATSTPAPSGPPALTAGAWLSGQAEMTDVPSSSHGEVTLVSVNKQMGLELDERSLQVRHTNQGEGGHAVNDDRDRARMDRRFARSTSLLTPQIFAETMANRVYNTFTATIEEVEPEPKGAAVHPSRVPDSTPAPVFTAPAETVQNTTPSSTPAALKPATPGSAPEKPSDV